MWDTLSIEAQNRRESHVIYWIHYSYSFPRKTKGSFNSIHHSDSKEKAFLYRIFSRTWRLRVRAIWHISVIHFCQNRLPIWEFKVLSVNSKHSGKSISAESVIQSPEWGLRATAIIVCKPLRHGSFTLLYHLFLELIGTFNQNSTRYLFHESQRWKSLGITKKSSTLKKNLILPVIFIFFSSVMNSWDVIAVSPHVPHVLHILHVLHSMHIL